MNRLNCTCASTEVPFRHCSANNLLFHAHLKVIHFTLIYGRIGLACISKYGNQASMTKELCEIWEIDEILRHHTWNG